MTRALSMAQRHRRFMIRTGQLSLICPPLAHSLLSPAALWARNIIAHPATNVNRHFAQILFFVQNAQNDTHGRVDTFCLCKLHNTPQQKINKIFCATLLTNGARCDTIKEQ